MLKYLNVPLGDYNASKQTFISTGNVCKMISPEASLSFVGSLTSLEDRVLESVNQLLHSNMQAISSALNQAHEEVHDDCRVLVDKGFVIDVGEGRHDITLSRNYLAKEQVSHV